MVILPRQLHTSASALDTKALGLDSEKFSQICERSLTWRGKDSRSQTWLQRWKRESWIQRLCSRTLNPSNTESFVDAWISSLAASRVNPSALLESVRELTTQDTSSPSSEMESESANPELFSSKMWKESSQPKPQMANQFSSMSSASWKAWVTARRREYSQRLKSALRTRESESSSLQVTWRTPQSQEPGISIERLKGKLDGARAYDKETGRLAQYGLTQQVQNWLTPKATEAHEKPGQYAKRLGRSENCHGSLSGQVTDTKNWPTVTVNESHNVPCPSQFKRNTPPLGTAVLIAGQPDQANPSTTGKSQESWPTPRANKVHPEITEDNREHLANRKKANLEEDIAGHCGKATGKLNPAWVEHLMGLPVGWTDLGFWETE